MTVRWFQPMPDSELDSAATTLFRREFDADPVGVWAAPGRVNLIGEHVDYAGGLSLPIALPHSTAVAVRFRNDGVIRLRSTGAEPWDGRLDDVGPGRPEGWAAYPAGVVWALREAGVPASGGVDAAFVSSVPIGAGLSSSAALECSLALALAPDIDRTVLAAACVRAENEVALAPTGGMDQAASLRSSKGCALLLDSASGAVSHVPFDPSSHGLELLVVDTRAPHRLVDGHYASRRAAVEQATRRLGVTSLREVADRGRDGEGAVRSLTDDILRRRARHVVTETARVRRAVTALEENDVAGFGRLLCASHLSLRRDFEVSSPELDSVVDAAMAAGALGARMTGGGFGGSAIALVPERLVDAVVAAVRGRAGERGLPDPAFATVTASAPGRRLS